MLFVESGVQVTMSAVKVGNDGLAMDITDEEIMKRKLMIDGEGLGDDRRINLLMTRFFQWINLIQSPQVDREEQDLIFNRMMHLINDCELTAEKCLLLNKTLEKEMQVYSQFKEDMLQEIEVTKSKIDVVKENLIQARQVRNNRKAYEPLVDEIQKFPSRQESMEKINQIRKDALLLESKKKTLLDRIAKRKVMIQALVSSSEELLSSLNSDEAFALEDLPDDDYLPTNSGRDSKKETSKKSREDSTQGSGN